MSLTIALLLPRSTTLPTIGKTYLDGFRSTINKEMGTTIYIEDYNAQDPIESCLEKAQKILFDKDPDITIALGDRSFLKGAGGLFESNRKLLIHSTLGANLPLKFTDTPFIVTNSFDIWKSSLALGTETANSEERFAFALDFYESGYQVHALFSAYIKSVGKEEAFYYLQPQKEYHIEQDRIRELCHASEQQAMFAGFSGKIAKSFLEDISSLQDIVKQLYLSPMFLLPGVVEGAAALTIPAKAATSWFPQLSEKTNKAWVEKWMDKTGELPSVFAMLGAEAGLWINEAATAAGETTNPLKLSESLCNVSFESPRGKVKGEEHMHSLVSNQRLVSIISSNGKAEIVEEKIIDVPNPEPYFETFRTLQDMGWKNIYPTT